MNGTVYVQPSGRDRWLASLAELPGCMAMGATREEALAALPDAFRDYVALLERHGVRLEHLQDLEPARFDVREPEERTTYPEDFRGMEEHELRDFLHHFEALHAELLKVVRDLTQEQLEARPSPEEWSVRECLQHVATGSVEIMSRLEPWPRGDFATLNAAHRLVVQRFAVMDATDTQGEHRVFGRRFSVKKTARRLLEHEYEHLRQVRETIAKLPSGS